MDKLKIKDIIDTINSCFDGLIITESDADKKLDELGIDSIGFISIIVKLEETYGVEFPDDKLIMSELDSAAEILNVMQEITKGDKV